MRCTAVRHQRKKDAKSKISPNITGRDWPKERRRRRRREGESTGKVIDEESIESLHLFATVSSRCLFVCLSLEMSEVLCLLCAARSTSAVSAAVTSTFFLLIIEAQIQRIGLAATVLLSLSLLCLLKREEENKAMDLHQTTTSSRDDGCNITTMRFMHVI